MFVQNHMDRDPVTTAPDVALGSAVDLMERRRIRYLPVVTAGAKLVGGLSDRDVWWTICHMGDEALRRPVHSMMDPDPPRIDLHAQVEDALVRMCDDDEPQALAVVSGGTIVGLLNRHHVLTLILRLIGADRGGSRIDVALPDMLEDLACAFQVLREVNATLLSAMAASSRDDGLEPVLSVRFHEPDAPSRGVERALARAGLLLLVPEHELGHTRNGNGASRPARSGGRLFPYCR